MHSYPTIPYTSIRLILHLNPSIFAILRRQLVERVSRPFGTCCHFVATTCNDFVCAARSVGFALRPGHVASRRAQRNSLSSRPIGTQLYMPIILPSSGDRRKDKAVTAMPSRLRDMSGHRRKAFLLAMLDKSLKVVAPKAQ